MKNWSQISEQAKTFVYYYCNMYYVSCNHLKSDKKLLDILPTRKCQASTLSELSFFFFVPGMMLWVLFCVTSFNYTPFSINCSAFQGPQGLPAYWEGGWNLGGDLTITMYDTWVMNVSHFVFKHWPRIKFSTMVISLFFCACVILNLTNVQWHTWLKGYTTSSIQPAILRIKLDFPTKAQ